MRGPKGESQQSGNDEAGIQVYSKLWLARQNLDLLPGQCTRPKRRFLELAVEMMDDLAAVCFGSDEQRLVVFYQRSATWPTGHKLPVAEQRQALAVIRSDEIMPRGSLNLRNWKTNPGQALLGPNLKMNISRHFASRPYQILIHVTRMLARDAPCDRTVFDGPISHVGTFPILERLRVKDGFKP